MNGRLILGDFSRQKINQYFLNLHEINLYVQLRTRVQKTYIGITRFKFLNGQSMLGNASRQINRYSIHNNALPYKQITIIHTIHEVKILTQHTTFTPKILTYNKYLFFHNFESAYQGREQKINLQNKNIFKRPQKYIFITLHIHTHKILQLFLNS